MRARGVLVAAVAAAAAAACGAPGAATPAATATLSRADVARVVSADLAAQDPAAGPAPAVECSDDVPARVGSVDQCVSADIVARTHRPVTATVTGLDPLTVALVVSAPTTPSFDP